MARKAKSKTPKTRKYRDVSSLIKKLDVSSLHPDDIITVMLHCASALNLKKALHTESLTSWFGGRCYTKSGSSDTVSIWEGGYEVGECSEAEAKAAGIPPCG